MQYLWPKFNVLRFSDSQDHQFFVISPKLAFGPLFVLERIRSIFGLFSTFFFFFRSSTTEKFISDSFPSITVIKAEFGRR